MQNKCFNCKYFFSCKRANEKTTNCEWFVENDIEEVKDVSIRYGEIINGDREQLKEFKVQ